MNTLDIGLLALALWITWYSIRAASAFRDLRNLVSDQPSRERAFLRPHVLGLHRLVPVQGRGHPYADAPATLHESPLLVAVLQGRASVPPSLLADLLPPLHLSPDWQEVRERHAEFIRTYQHEADQVVLRG